MALKVFVSYAREDRDSALQCYSRLVDEGVIPWIDVKNLLPGQNWEAEISRAFAEANVILLLLSPRSVDKRGFVQREANEAIQGLRYKKPTDIYVIPLLLEPCEVPNHIAERLQYVDLNSDGAWDKVKQALRVAAEQQSIQFEQGVVHGPFNIFTAQLQEKRDGWPGYEIAIDYPRFESKHKSDAAKELSAFFSGRAYTALIAERQNPWDQSPELFENRNPDIARNGRWEGFGVANATSSLLSLAYEVGWYGAGAAHPNMHFDTYNFFYAEQLFQLDFHDFFLDISAAIERVSEICLRCLARQYWERTGKQPNHDQARWFTDGAGAKLDNFRSFTVSSNHFTFLFAPFQIGSYAMGHWAVDVPFYDLLPILKPDGPHVYARAST